MAKKDEPLSPGEIAAAKARMEGTPLDGALGAHVLGISGQADAGEQLAKASRENAAKAAAADEADDNKKASHATAVKAAAEAQKGPGSAIAGQDNGGTTTPSGLQADKKADDKKAE